MKIPVNKFPLNQVFPQRMEVTPKHVPIPQSEASELFDVLCSRIPQFGELDISAGEI